eukprot:NODE_74_length_23402_cov_1.166974.p7 type:complete len:147 gc:universal NODE_74_length_23402_cov_1.166974:445-885(+)
MMFLAILFSFVIPGHGGISISEHYPTVPITILSRASSGTSEDDGILAKFYRYKDRLYNLDTNMYAEHIGALNALKATINEGDKIAAILEKYMEDDEITYDVDPLFENLASKTEEMKKFLNKIKEDSNPERATRNDSNGLLFHIEDI